MTNPSFSEIDLPEALASNLSSLGYEEMTAIQTQALPLVLAGEDLIGQAKTGSGKTAVFGLGILSKLIIDEYYTQALVLCPTRELADQVAGEIRRLARGIPNIKVLTVCGGVPFGPQANSLASGAHIVVGTPGRIEDHIGKDTIKLGRVNTLVLDEADRMLDMGFQEVLEKIVGEIPSQRQTLLFSATFPAAIETISQRFANQAKKVKIGANASNLDIDQHFHRIENGGRIKAVQLLLMEHEPESSIVFCNTKQETNELAQALRDMNFDVLALHGDLDQPERDLVMTRFANKSASILVATDVASRGLDIEALDAVINYQIARNLDVHIHRIGRTGRAGRTGQAFTLYTDQEKLKLQQLGEQLNLYIENEPLPPKAALNKIVPRCKMITIQISGGKKQKVRPGDILGALTGDSGIAGSDVGKIKIGPASSFVAVSREVIKQALVKLGQDKIKGRNFKVRSL
ncbi:MAG: ATP-independent RNA helicase DbpA [Arenicella sp.]